MKFALQDKIQDKQQEQDIVLDGEIVGYLITHPEKDGARRFHACLRVAKESTVAGVGHLIQGHGETVEKAIFDAFKRGREDAETILSGIGILKAKFDYPEPCYHCGAALPQEWDSDVSPWVDSGYCSAGCQADANE
jgi:hypothetical protein